MENEESAILKIVKSKNPDKEYPSALGKLWTSEEDTQLLEELSQNLDKEEIAKNHNRTIGGINSRIRDVAYKMYKNNMSVEEIMEKTKLVEEQVSALSQKRRRRTNSRSNTTRTDDNNTNISHLENDIVELKEQLRIVNEKLSSVLEQSS